VLHKSTFYFLSFLRDRQLSESRQKVSSLAEQLDAKTTVSSTTADGRGSENGSDDVSALKVCVVQLF